MYVAVLAHQHLFSPLSGSAALRPTEEDEGYTNIWPTGSGLVTWAS